MPRYHYRVSRLPPTVVGNPEYDRLEDVRMVIQRALHLGAIHVLAAGDDHVLCAVDEEDVRMGVAVAEVAGPVPPIAQDLGGLPRPLPVGEHDTGTSHDDLADDAWRDIPGVDVDDACVDAHRRLPARSDLRLVEQPLLM